MPVYKNIAGVLTKAKYVWEQNAGAWRRLNVYAHQNPLVVCHQGVIRVTVAAGTYNGWTLTDYITVPNHPVLVIITVESGAYMRGTLTWSTQTKYAGLITGTLPAGSIVRIINNGYIYGYGGRGGTGGYVTSSGLAGCHFTPCSGSAGGDAIDTNVDLEIDNANGFIFGGGGGGGGGGAANYNGVTCSGSGGGAGAGHAYLVGSSYNYGPRGLLSTYGVNKNCLGNPGTTNGLDTPPTYGVGGAQVDCVQSGAACARGGAGGNGGDFGQAGSAGAPGKIGQPTNCTAYGNWQGGSAGGQPGKAIDLNGRTVTWIAGNTSSRVKGAVS